MAGHDKITREGKKFLKELKELTKLELRVGFQHGEEKDKNSGADMVDIAMWNELGTARSPPRPFLRQSVDNNTAQIEAMCKAQVQAIALGEATAKDALQAIGVFQKALVQHTIRDGDFAPNEESTIWRKSKKALRVKKDADGNSVKIKSGKNKGKSMKRLVITKLSDKPLIDTSRMRQSVNFVIEEKKGR